MRWLVTAVAVGFLCCASPSARAGDEPPITMQLNDISVSDALRKVSAQAKVRCVIDGEVTGKVQALSLSDVPLKAAVRTLARYANADFEVKDGAYFVKPKAADPPKVVNQPAPVGPPPMFPAAVPERPVAKQQPPEGGALGIRRANPSSCGASIEPPPTRRWRPFQAQGAASTSACCGD